MVLKIKKSKNVFNLEKLKKGKYSSHDIRDKAEHLKMERELPHALKDLYCVEVLKAIKNKHVDKEQAVALVANLINTAESEKKGSEPVGLSPDIRNQIRSLSREIMYWRTDNYNSSSYCMGFDILYGAITLCKESNTFDDSTENSDNSIELIENEIEYLNYYAGKNMKNRKCVIDIYKKVILSITRFMIDVVNENDNPLIEEAIISEFVSNLCSYPSSIMFDFVEKQILHDQQIMMLTLKDGLNK